MKKSEMLIKIECSAGWQGWYDWAEYRSLISATRECDRLIDAGRTVRWTNLESGLVTVHKPRKGE